MSKQCLARLQKEYKAILREPVPYVQAHPSPSNLLEWFFVLEGVQGTPYDGGFYMGKLVFPPQFPFKPPALVMVTPSGRFETNKQICMSMTNFHPEAWSPMWSVSSVLTGFLSFFNEEGVISTGSIITSRGEKLRLAASSLEYNVRLPMFRKLFPHLCELFEERQRLSSQKCHPQHAGQQDSPGNAQACAANSSCSKRGSSYWAVAAVAAAVALLAVSVSVLFDRAE